MQPSDQLLEIGCGHGILLSRVAERLAAGKITAIDRSEKMVAAASKRNAAHITAGKAEIFQGELATAELGGRKFDKVFAFNVNIFWMDPQRELAAVRQMIVPGGMLYLFFDPPSPGQAEPTAARLKANLQAGGFRVHRIEFAAIGAGKAVCAMATAA